LGFGFVLCLLLSNNGSIIKNIFHTFPSFKLDHFPNFLIRLQNSKILSKYFIKRLFSKLSRKSEENKIIEHFGHFSLNNFPIILQSFKFSDFNSNLRDNLELFNNWKYEILKLINVDFPIVKYSPKITNSIRGDDFVKFSKFSFFYFYFLFSLRKSHSGKILSHSSQNIIQINDSHNSIISNNNYNIKRFNSYFKFLDKFLHFNQSPNVLGISEFELFLGSLNGGLLYPFPQKIIQNNSLFLLPSPTVLLNHLRFSNYNQLTSNNLLRNKNISVFLRSFMKNNFFFSSYFTSLLTHNIFPQFFKHFGYECFDFVHPFIQSFLSNPILLVNSHPFSHFFTHGIPSSAFPLHLTIERSRFHLNYSPYLFSVSFSNFFNLISLLSSLFHSHYLFSSSFQTLLQKSTP
jgi:hypothetical protein